MATHLYSSVLLVVPTRGPMWKQPKSPLSPFFFTASIPHWKPIQAALEIEFASMNNEAKLPDEKAAGRQI